VGLSERGNFFEMAMRNALEISTPKPLGSSIQFEKAKMLLIVKKD
jgi:hypothetical protein